MKKLPLAAILLFALLGFSASAQDYKIENNEVKLSKQITFKPGTATILTESEAALLIIKKYLEDKSYISLLRVEAHTDNTGDAEANLLLSKKRAAAVCQQLIAMGVDCMRLLPVGFGGTKPVADNSAPEGASQNRRITFVNAGIKGKAIAGMPVDGGGTIVENPCY